jgi:hypothetical protein
MEMLTWTEIDASAPKTVTKRFGLRDGGVYKETVANIYQGHMRICRGVNPNEFVTALKALKSNQCFAYGQPPYEAALLPEKKWIELGRPSDALPRTNEVFSWPEGAGVLLLDYDAPKDGSATLTQDELIGLLRQACPRIDQSQIVWWPSTSSFIYERDKEINGLRGQRIYLFVHNAQDIPRAGKALNDRLWALGHGRFEVSKSGSLLERPIFDGSVWQPNRIDFAAGAECLDGLEQRRGEPLIVGAEFKPLDTASAIPDLSAKEKQACAEAKAQAKALLSNDAALARDEWVEARIDEMITANPRAKRDECKAQVSRAVDRRELMGDWPLEVLDGGQVINTTVGEVLDHVERFHGLKTRDPLEPDYDGGRWVGKLYLYSARPILNSFAHGGVKFRLTRQPLRIEAVRGKAAETTDALLQVLRRAPDMFDFGNELVLVAAGGKVYPLNEHGLRHEAGKQTQFWGWRKTPHGMVEELLDPPAAVCKSVLSMGDRRGLKPLSAVITAPTLRPDGSVISKPGYDSETGLLFEMVGDSAIAIDEFPSHEQAIKALEFLWYPFAQFPFATELDRAVHLAAVITAAVRPILPTAPAFGYDAPVQGSGKTLLARCVGVLTDGQEPSVWPHTAGRDDEEVRKRLFTVLRSGARSLIWDNVIGVFDSAALASCLTSPTYSDRILGASLSSTVPNRAVFVLTGNNLTLAGDLPRRVLVCRIDPETEKPFARKFDLDPVGFCRIHRQRMIASALTLIRATLTHGRQDAGAGRLASFEDWDTWVRQAVIYANELWPQQFGDVMHVVTAAQSTDPEQEMLSALLVAWHNEFGSSQVTTAEVLQRANKGLDSPLLDAIREFSTHQQVTQRGLGRMLRFRADRICGGMKLQMLKKNTSGIRYWRVLEMPKF